MPQEMKREQQKNCRKKKDKASKQNLKTKYLIPFNFSEKYILRFSFD